MGKYVKVKVHVKVKKLINILSETQNKTPSTILKNAVNLYYAYHDDIHAGRVRIVYNDDDHVDVVLTGKDFEL